MGFFDRIADDNARDDTAERAMDDAREADLMRIMEIREKIVLAKLREFGDQHGVEVVDMGPYGDRRYFTIDDFVFSVRLFPSIDSNQLTVVSRVPVLWQYAIALVGIDRTDSLAEATPSALLLISYGTIREAFNACPELEFRAKTVVPILLSYPRKPTEPVGHPANARRDDRRAFALVMNFCL